MVTALLTRRAAPLAARTMRGVRFAHVENTHETALPFKQGPNHKTGLALGVVGFLGFGFSLPFLAAKFQLSKS